MKSDRQFIINEIIGFFCEKEFLSKVKLTLWMLFFYRLISFIPLPGVDISLVTKDLLDQKLSGSLLSFLNKFSGGALHHMTIMALGISPYIMCSVTLTFGHHLSSHLQSLKKEGALGRKKLNNYTKLLSFFVSFFQGGGVAYSALQSNNLALVPGWFFILQTALLLATGTMVVIWFSDQIATRGLGKGSSFIIYVNIISGVLPFLQDLFIGYKSNLLPTYKFILFLLMSLFLLFFVTFCERVYKTIKAQNLFANKAMFLKNMPQHLVYMKLNPAGIFPSMFAGFWFSIPGWIDAFFNFSKYEYGACLMASLTPGSYTYVALHAFFIFISSYAYAEIVFNPAETASRFRNDTIIAGKLPGKSTQEFLEEKLFYVATLGGIYLVLVCCLPDLFGAKGSQLLAISGTSYIIIVGVAIDLIDKISAGIYARLTDKALKAVQKGYFK